MTGSRGAGITLTDGVTVTVEPADERTVQLNGGEIQMAPVERVMDTFGIDARVVAESALPLGAGFGVSGAITLGTALATNNVFPLNRSENELIELAHIAEVEAGTGLGDVVAQARGGVPIRVEPGGPSHGTLDGVPETGRIEWVSFGDLSTTSILSGDTRLLSEAGESALASLRERPTLPRLFELGGTFAREANLLVPSVTTVINEVEREGGTAMMAMLGETVVALNTGLSDIGVDDVSTCQVHSGGASMKNA